jgi:hypothetical protein
MRIIGRIGQRLARLAHLWEVAAYSCFRLPSGKCQRAIRQEHAVRTVSGYIQLSPQMYDDLQRYKCQERSDDRYAWLGERSTCVCGQHEYPVPLAPLFGACDEGDNLSGVPV